MSDAERLQGLLRSVERVVKYLDTAGMVNRRHVRKWLGDAVDEARVSE